MLIKKSNIVNDNEEDTSSLTAKIRNTERQMLEGKLMLLGDDSERLKPGMSAFDFSAKSQEQLLCTTALGTIFGVESNELRVAVESAAKAAPTSYASSVSDLSNRKANFHVFETGIPTSDKIDVQIHMSLVLECNARFKNPKTYGGQDDTIKFLLHLLSELHTCGR
nr:hypothetical protein [Tanacetum cinerariifolium]